MTYRLDFARWRVTFRLQGLASLVAFEFAVLEDLRSGTFSSAPVHIKLRELGVLL